MKFKKLLKLLPIIGLVIAGPAFAYQVKSGDTLSKIAQANHTSVSQIVAQNKLSDPNKIYVGQNLNLADESLGAAIPVSTPLFQSSLLSPITSSASSMTLVSGVDKAGTSLSGFVCFTIDSGTPQVEYTCGTAAGTAISGLTRGVGPDGITPVTALQFAHRRGADVRVTDFPTLGILSRVLNGQNSVPNLLYYETGVGATGAGASSTDIMSKAYIDLVGAGGFTSANVATTKGLYALGTSPETVGVAASSTSGLGFNSVTHSLEIVNNPTGAITQSSSGLDVRLNSSSLVKNGSSALTVVTSTTGLAATIPLGDGTNHLDSSWIPTSVQSKFGGDGTDGALSITAGTTSTINLANARYVVKNYTSITIPATAALTFSNPNANGTIVVLKATGNSTIGGIIYGVGLGAPVGADNNYPLDALVHKGTGTGTAGTAGVQYTLTRLLFTQVYKDSIVVPGPGGVAGGAGSSGDSPGGAGGAGGIGLRMEVKGTYTFTGAINIGGGTGVVGTIGSGSDCGRMGGSGGSGGGGTYHILVGTLSTNSGVYQVAGGAAVTGSHVASNSSCGGTPGYGGAGAGSYAGAGTKGGNGGTTDGGAGGQGADGGGAIEVNTEF